MLLGHGVKRLRKLSTHSRKSFQNSPFWKDLISARFSFYTLTGVLLVLVLFLANLMRKARNMLLPMHPEITIRLKATFHKRGSVLLLYGPSYISGPIFMAPISLCIPTTSLSNGWWPMTSLLVNKLVGRLYFKSMSSRLFTDLVLHIRTQIPCHGNPSLPLKIFQKPSKTSTRFQLYMYLIHLVILHYCNVTWLSIPLWIYGRTLRFFQHGEHPPQVTSSHRNCIQQWSKRYSWRESPRPMLTTRQQSGSSTTWTAWSYLEGTLGAWTLWS